METKNEKFLRMLNGRLPKAIKAIELLANLSRKSDYEWTPAQLQSMFDQLDDAVDVVAGAFGALPSTPPGKVDQPPASPAEGEVDVLALMQAEQRRMLVNDDRVSSFRLVLEARRVGDEELAKATLDAIIDRWLKLDDRPH